jgi:hypothetical protein
VVVLGAGEAGETAVDTEAIAHKLLADGLKPSKAARELAQIAGISGDEAYEIVRGLRPGS